MAENSNIQGNLRLSSGINTNDTGTGKLYTDTIQESTPASGVSVLNSDLVVSNTGTPTLTFNNNGSLFNISSVSGNVSLKNTGGKGITIANTTGNITVDSTTDSINDSTGSVILEGGLLIKKSMNVKEEIHGLNGIHEFINTSVDDHVISIQNTNTGGFSTIQFKNSLGTPKLELGHGNSTVGSPLTNVSYLQSLGATDLFFRVNETDAMKINNDTSIEIYNTTPTTSFNSGGVRIFSGVAVSNTTNASSNSNGGSMSLGGGLAVNKDTYIGGNLFMTGTISAGNNKILDVSSPTASSDAVNKQYVDTSVSELRLKKNVRVATTSALVLVSDFEAGDTVDGITLALNDRILIKNQANGIENGIYTVNASGAPTRATDFSIGSPVGSAFVVVQQGTTNADTLWVCSNNTSSDIVGTDSLSFIQIQGGGGGGGTYFAGTGLTLTGGDTFNVNASQTQITAVGTLTTGTWNANVIQVPYGGTGNSSFTQNAVLLGNSSSAIVAGSGITYASNILTLPRITSNNTTTTTSSTTGAIRMSGGLGISNTTDAVSATNGGTITTAGGLAVAKKAFVGTDLSVGGNVSITGSVLSGTWNGSTVSVPYGGTGATSFTATAVLLGNGTNAIVAGSGITYASSTLTLPKIVSNDSTASTTPGTGAVLLSGGLGISNTTDAISATNGGTITTAGGLAVAKKAFIGTDLSVGGNVSITGTVLSGTWNGSTVSVPYGGTGATSFTATAVLLGNGTNAVYSGASITYASSTLTLPKIVSNDSTASTTSGTGAVLLSGGLGISNTTDAVSATNGGTITTAGGLAVAKKTFVGTDLSIGRYTRMFDNIAPSTPASGHEFYMDNADNKLKSVDTSGTVKVYNPNNTKGDLITHNGITDVRLPVGTVNQILYADPALSSGIGWKNLSSETTVINPNISKYFESYNSASNSISDTYSNMVIDTIRTNDVDYFTYQNNSELTVLSSGRYSVYCKLSIEGISGNSPTSASLIIQSGSSNVFTDVLGTLSYTQMFNSGSGSLCSCISSCILQLSANDQIRVRIRREYGGSTIQTLPNGCNLFVKRVFIDEQNDNSAYINTYNTSNQSLSGSFQDIVLNTNRIIDSSFTHIPSSDEVILNENGIYFVYTTIGFTKTANTTPTETETYLSLSDTLGANHTQVPGTLSYCFLDESGIYHSCNIHCVLNVSAGQRIKLVSRISVGSAVSCVAQSCQVNVYKYQSTTSGQSEVKFIDLYDTTTQSIGVSFTDITFNTQRITNAIYSHTLGTSEITVNESGKYIIVAKLATYNTSGNTNTSSSSQARILLNTGSGFSAISGHISNTVNVYSTAGKGTIPLVLSLTLSAGSSVKLQCVRAQGSGSIETVANASCFSVFKVEPAEESVDSILKFGTRYEYVESPATSSTTSTSYIQKLRLTTGLIPDGYYRIGCFYIAYSDVNNKNIDIQLDVDDSNVIQEVSESLVSTARSPSYIFKQVQLTAGIHNIDLDYKSEDGSTVYIKDVRMEFWRLF